MVTAPPPDYTLHRARHYDPNAGYTAPTSPPTFCSVTHSQTATPTLEQPLPCSSSLLPLHRSDNYFTRPQFGLLPRPPTCTVQRAGITSPLFHSQPTPTPSPTPLHPTLRFLTFQVGQRFCFPPPAPSATTFSSTFSSRLVFVTLFYHTTFSDQLFYHFNFHNFGSSLSLLPRVTTTFLFSS